MLFEKKILTLILLLFTFSVNSQNNSAPFYFVQISDTHIGLENSYQRTGAILKKINSLPVKIDFIVHTGDVFDDFATDSLVSKSINLFNESKVPVYWLLGNHDMKNDKVVNMKSHEFNYLYQHKGVHLAFISSFDSLLNPGDKVFTWLQDTIKALKKYPLLLFHHQPFTESSYSKAELSKIEKVLSVLNPMAIFAGHLHVDALVYHKHIPEFVLPCVSDFDERQNSFRLYECKDGKMSFRTFYLN